jgi:hypothetical protein
MPLGVMCDAHDGLMRGVLQHRSKSLVVIYLDGYNEIRRVDAWKVKLAPAEYQSWLFDIEEIPFLSKVLVDVEDGEKKYQVIGLHPSYRYPTLKECLA